MDEFNADFDLIDTVGSGYISNKELENFY